MKWWNIERLKEEQPTDWINHILFAHAWGGCDTTYAGYREGQLLFVLLKKIASLKKNA